MKKNLLKILGGLCIATMAAGLASCNLLPGMGSSSTGESSKPDSSSVAPAVTYTLDSTSFNKEVVFGTALNTQGLSIKASTGKTIAVTNEMVSGWSTDSVGEKTLTVKYEGATVGTVKYTVKYEVKFVVDGEVVKTQLVTKASDVEYPADPEKTGYDFDGWSTPSLETLNGNLTITAQFKGEETPEPGTITIAGDAVYVREFGEDGQLAISASFGTLAAKDYEVALSNENVTVTKGRGIILVNPVKAGVTTLTVTASDPITGDAIEATKTIIVKPRSLMINEVKLGSGDIEGIYTIGRTDVSGQVTTFDFDVSCGTQDDVGAGLLDNIVWISNNKNATIDNEGKVTLAEGSGAEMVSFTAKFVVNGVEYDVSEAYTVRCVYDAVNVGSYNDLYTATKAGKAIVLNKDIKEDFSATNYEEMPTTYNDTYYKNKKETAKIKTLLQFKNDLYGNGYQINAHNATLGTLDATGALTDNSIFRGPLNFVAMGSEGAGMLSVKAQDNVCFALFEGVTVNNVELRGCDLTMDPDTNSYDLTDLNYAGTTVEVFGDDVTIEYSRITNGRTVLRIFGDVANSEKAINVNVKNSVLSGAREFILRIGSNRFVKDENNASPYLTGDANGTFLNAKKMNSDNYYGNMTAAQKQSYDDQFINTFVTIKNSVFKDAGIFAVGMDAHFAGPALHDPESNSLIMSVLGESAAYWKNIARTSYGAKLTFEGDVRLYNWKPLDQIDSSTLLENITPEGLNWEWKDLTFDVKSMVEGVVTGEDALFPTIVTEMNGKNWVHAGIAFFGGGRNYSVFENSDSSEPLVGFTVSLDDVGQTMLKTAAGEENFYFMLCDQTSKFTPQEQERILNSDDAYSCLKK